MTPTDRPVSGGDPRLHLGAQRRDEGVQMSGSSVVPGPFGREVGEDVGGVERPAASGRGPAGVTPCSVCSNARARLRASRRLIGHAGDRSAARAVAALALTATAVVVPGLATPAAQGADEEGHLHRGVPRRGRLVQPVQRLPGVVVRGVGDDVRLHGRLLDGGHVAGAGARDVVGDLRGRPDLDLRHPRGGHLVRRRAADRGRHRLHLQPDPRRRARGGELGDLPDVGGDRHRSRRHDGGARARAAERRAAAAADPDPARARLVRGARGRGEVLPQRAHRRRARGGVRDGSGSWRARQAARRTCSRPTPTTGTAPRTSTGWRSGCTRARIPRSRR